MNTPLINRLRSGLDALYERFNLPQWIDPDPLAVALDYRDPRDREVASLVAALLAFGRVRQIMKAARQALAPWPRPHTDLARALPREISRTARGFRHRYAGEAELAGLLSGIAAALRSHGSLEAAFGAARRPGDAGLVPALTRFVDGLRQGGPVNCLLPNPALGGACKRWFLFLRWMARRDEVDLGLWRSVKPSDLVMPLDTHMHRLSIKLGFTARRTADLQAALETTAAFAAIRADDPVRYDFCLTRAALHDPAALDQLISLPR